MINLDLTHLWKILTQDAVSQWKASVEIQPIRSCHFQKLNEWYRDSEFKTPVLVDCAPQMELKSKFWTQYPDKYLNQHMNQLDAFRLDANLPEV